MTRPETYDDYRAKFRPSGAPYLYAMIPLFLMIFTSVQWTAYIVPPVIVAPVVVQTREQPVGNPIADNDRPELRIDYTNRVITKYARAYGIDPDLAFSVAWCESGMNELCVSPAGARGLFQILASDQDELVRKYLGWDPAGFVWGQAEDSAALGCAYLSSLIRRFGVWGGVASYNCGSRRFGGVWQFEYRSLPDQTWDYVHRVFGGME